MHGEEQFSQLRCLWIVISATLVMERPFERVTDVSTRHELGSGSAKSPECCRVVPGLRDELAGEAKGVGVIAEAKRSPRSAEVEVPRGERQSLCMGIVDEVSNLAARVKRTSQFPGAVGGLGGVLGDVGGNLGGVLFGVTEVLNVKRSPQRIARPSSPTALTVRAARLDRQCE